jgi:hypothetical protein
VKRSQEPIITEEDGVDLSQASFSASLSSTEMDEETQRFYVTIDKVLFKKPLEIVSTVLDAQGYALNLENLLACLDHFTIGTKVSVPSRQLQYPCPRAKTYMPCIEFPLPQKNKVGPILKRFYDEIANYEAELTKLRGDESPSKKGKTNRDDDLKKERDEFSQENRELKQELKSLKAELSAQIKTSRHAHKALESQKIIPPNLRLATVRDIVINDRLIILKAGRTSIQLPIMLVHTVPNVGDKGLVHIENGVVMGAYFYEGSGTALTPRVAKVLYADRFNCKIRDDARKVTLLNSKNQIEEDLFTGLRRGDKVLAFRYQQAIIRLEPIPQTDDSIHIKRIHEDIALHQLRDKPTNSSSCMQKFGYKKTET